MIERDQVRDMISRMVDVWPSLRNKDALRNEIGEAVFRDRARLEPSDLNRGCDLLLKTFPTTANDGGPAWPPGPREVVSAVHQARSDRITVGNRRRDNGSPRKIAGRVCKRHGCHGELSLVSNVLWCDNCRSVQVMEYRDGAPVIHVGAAESGLTFADEAALRPVPVSHVVDMVTTA